MFPNVLHTENLGTRMDGACTVYIFNNLIYVHKPLIILLKKAITMVSQK